MRPHWYRFMPLFLALTACCLQLAVAGNGKIEGVIRGADGAAISGANVVVQGTALGAAADANGHYFILNVPPGVYQLRATSVGYTTQVFTNVLVRSDQIVTMNFTMNAEAVGLNEIVVEATRPPVDKSRTSTKTTMLSDDFTNLPVRSTLDLVQTAPSMFNGFMRGGRQYETKTVIDGIDLTDQYYAASADLPGGNTPYLTYNGINRQQQAVRSSLVTLNVGSVQEADVLTGGIGSDYNSASAGVIAYTLREARGGFSGRANFRTSQTGGLKINGPSLYNDQAVYFAQKALLTDSKTLSDNQKAARFTWTPDKYSFGNKPTVNAEVDLGGNFNEQVGVYFTSAYTDDHGRLPNEHTKLVDGSLKAHYNFTPDLRLNFTGLLEDRGRLFGWKNSTYMDDFRYFLEGVPVWDGVNFSGTVKLTDMLTPNTFFEVSLATVNDNSRRGYVDGNNDGNITLNESGDFLTFADTAQVNRYMANAGNSQFNKFFSPTPRNESGSELGVVSDGVSNWKIARPGIYYENFWNRQYTLRGDFTSQVDAHHQLRAGLQAMLHDYNMTRRAGYIGGVYSTFKNYVEEIWDVKPREYALYAQDKMEYAGMIINLGFRIDGLDLAAGDYANYFAPFKTDTVFGGPARVPVRGDNVPVKWFFSPRVGVSHPISDQAMMYFSFSQQQQSQPFSRLYTNYQDFGNPSLPVIVRVGQDPIKSTNYDLGVQWAFYQDYTLEVNAYYKDVQNYGVTSFVVTPKAPWRSYNLITNFGYADCRGVELSIRKNLGAIANFLSIGGRVSYAYSYVKQSVGTGGNVNAFSTVPDSAKYNGGLPFGDIQYWNTIEQNVTGTNTTLAGGYDRAHRITFNLMFRFPYDVLLSALGTFQSGFYYPLTLGDPRSRALGTSPWDKNVNIRIEKGFQIPSVGRASIYADVVNAFNWTNILSYQRNSDIGQMAFEKTGDPTGGPLIQRAVTQDGSLIYDVPREVYFGVNLEF